jgi:GR25 family glycosyltransferase involved in LPS biosynthesis
MEYVDFLNAPCKLINLTKNTARFTISKERIQEAGFTNIERFNAIDIHHLDENWKLLNNPVIASQKDPCFYKFPGKQGCFLSHILIWKDIIEKQTPITTIFEDDILFHDKWKEIAPVYFKNTPHTYDILYLGSQFEAPSNFHIDRVPVYCLHAYVITYEGAKKLYNLVLNNELGVYTIDCMLLDFMKKDAFNWVVWNGYKFFPPKQQMSQQWAIRNHGLVYQDEIFGSDIITDLHNSTFIGGST